MTKKVILIVDDEVDMVNIVNFYIKYDTKYTTIPICVSQKNERYKDIQFVDSSLDIIQFCKDNKVDVIISDFYMPGATGEELKKELVKQGIDTPVILMSGSHIEDEQVRSLFHTCLKKPFMEPDIKRTLESV